MSRGKNFQERLGALKEKHGLTSREMGQLFGLGYRMYEDLQNGTYVPKKSGTVNKYTKILERLEKEIDLKALIPQKSNSNQSTTSNIVDKKDDIIREQKETIRILQLAIEALTLNSKLQLEEAEKNQRQSRQHG